MVVASPKPSDDIPPIEQTLSAGAATLSLLNAALADGWGANWLTGWPARDRALAEGFLGLGEQEWITGFIHLGSCTTAVPERPRPDIAKLITWRDA